MQESFDYQNPKIVSDCVNCDCDTIVSVVQSQEDLALSSISSLKSFNRGHKYTQFVFLTTE